jgi:hypothetical protein
MSRMMLSSPPSLHNRYPTLLQLCALESDRCDGTYAALTLCMSFVWHYPAAELMAIMSLAERLKKLSAEKEDLTARLEVGVQIFCFG